jgi:hypothetical protein
LCKTLISPCATNKSGKSSAWEYSLGSAFLLFIYDLFNDAVSSSDDVASNGGLVSNWEEMVMAYFEALPWNFPGETEEYHGNLSQDSQYIGWDLSRPPPEKKPEILPLGRISSVYISLNVQNIEKTTNGIYL